MAAIPSQRQRCRRFDWCTAVGRGHRVHVGEVQSITTDRGTRLRLSLTAEDDRPPTLVLEAAFHVDDPLMEVAVLDPAEALELAGIFLRLTRTAHVGADRRTTDHNH